MYILTPYDKYKDREVLQSHPQHLNLLNILHIHPWHQLKYPLKIEN